jgi:hypothetical protein
LKEWLSFYNCVTATSIMKKLSIIFLFVLLFVGCGKPPEACMELSSNNVVAGAAIEFTSCSKRALSFEWFIAGPEGAPENEIGWSNPEFSHAFTVPGAYTVTLNAYHDFSFMGDVSTIQENFTVN